MFAFLSKSFLLALITILNFLQYRLNIKELQSVWRGVFESISSIDQPAKTLVRIILLLYKDLRNVIRVSYSQITLTIKPSISLLGHGTFKNFILIETLLHNLIVHVFVDTLTEILNKPGNIKIKAIFHCTNRILAYQWTLSCRVIPYLGKDLVSVYLFSFTIEII